MGIGVVQALLYLSLWQVLLDVHVEFVLDQHLPHFYIDLFQTFEYILKTY